VPKAHRNIHFNTAKRTWDRKKEKENKLKRVRKGWWRQ
jgi:hypothetical protein